MSVVPCGQTPTAECGSYSDSASSVPFAFTTSNGNPLLMHAKETHGVCYTTNVSYDSNGIATNFVNSNGYVATGRTWTLYPFHIEARGTANISYNSSGELIVTLNDIISTLTGSAGDIGNEFRAYLYTAGDVAWAINVKLLNTSNPTAPAESDSGWNKCMGGWWSAAARATCSDHCPDGGTLYWWNSWGRFGTPYEHHGNTPTRSNTGLSWNLGRVTSYTEQLIAIYARAVRGGCGSAYFSPADGSMQQCIVISIPPMNLCPPTFNSMENDRDICEGTITTSINITTPTLGTDGVTLVVMYEAINSESEWADNKATTQTVYNVSSDATFDVELQQELIPDTTYFFKIYLEKDGRKSDEIMICDQTTPYMPSATCLVPLFTEAECEVLAAGDCLDELTEETAEECC